jgi:hypothetical protein
MNQGYVDQCLIVDEEFNTDMTMFFFLIFWKISMNHYGISAQITVNYQSLHMCSPLSQIMS